MYEVHGQAFRTKAEVRAVADAIRDSVPRRCGVRGDARLFVLALLAHYEEAEDKMRDGVEKLGSR